LDIVSFIALVIGVVALSVLAIISLLILLEVRKIKKNVKELNYSLNTINTSLVHHDSKLSLMIKHLSVIGSKLAPDRYKTKSSGM
jgi:hypothetical protein